MDIDMCRYTSSLAPGGRSAPPSSSFGVGSATRKTLVIYMYIYIYIYIIYIYIYMCVCVCIKLYRSV